MTDSPLEDSKRMWREHPEMPGYCTIDLAGSVMTEAVQKVADEINAEFGEVHIKNEFLRAA